MVIRRATAEDAAGIAVVHVLGWQTVYRGVIPQDYLDNLDPVQRAEMWVGRLAAQEWPRAGTLVATSGVDGANVGNVEGFVGFGPSRDGDADPLLVGEIATIYLHPTQWRAGLGRRLVGVAL